MQKNLRAAIGLIVLTVNPTLAKAEDVAQRFVGEMGLGTNFSQIMQGSAARTQTYLNVICLMGVDQGVALMQGAVSESVKKHQAEWDRNLANAWTTALSEEEMISLLSLKQNSRFVSKFKAALPAVGEKMQASSTDLVQKSLAEALADVWHRAPKDQAPTSSRGCKHD